MQKLLALIEKHKNQHAEAVQRFRSLITTHGEACLYRDCLPGHITGSALLISNDGKRVLLNHHKFLNLWLGFGGHADGDADIVAVCRRETEEESGLSDFELLAAETLDIDIHPIPANDQKGEPPHDHYDIRTIFRLREGASEESAISDESLALRWASFDEAVELTSVDKSMQRMLQLWQKHCA